MTQNTTEARIAQFAEWFDLELPALEYEEGSVLLTDTLLQWCNDSGVSLDWIFCGDPKGMAIAYRAEFERQRPFRDILRGFDRTEQRFLADALEADHAGTASLQDALATFKGKVEAHRAIQP